MEDQSPDRLPDPSQDLESVSEESEDVFSTRVEAGRNAGGGPLHRHLHQTERLVVEDGVLRVRTGLRGWRLVGPGEEIIIPPGQPHTFSVQTSSARYVAQFTPRLKVAEYFRELFALDNPGLRDMARLARKYPMEHFYLPIVPPVIQRGVLRPFA